MRPETGRHQGGPYAAFDGTACCHGISGVPFGQLRKHNVSVWLTPHTVTSFGRINRGREDARSRPRSVRPPGSAGADAAGARGDRSGGHLGERPAGTDPVADDLRKAAGQDVQVALAGADALGDERRQGKPGRANPSLLRH